MHSDSKGQFRSTDAVITQAGGPVVKVPSREYNPTINDPRIEKVKILRP